MAILTDLRAEATRYANGGPIDKQGTGTWDEFTDGCRLLTRAMAERLGFWDEGLGNWREEREDANHDDCD